MKNYNQLLDRIIKTGINSTDRTGTGTLSLFGEQLRYDLRQGFPAVTTKRLMWRAVVAELLWFIEGSGDERRLAEIQYGTRDESKKTIWSANADADYWKDKAVFPGDLGRVYGVQWRDWHSPRFDGVANFTSTDQLKDLIAGLKKDPTGRRHVLTAWNPGELNQMALPPCHMFAQFYLRDNELSCQMYQRSADMFLGVPFNIASYSLLTHLIAKEIGATAREFILTFGDAHVYNNHLEQCDEQLSRSYYPLAELDISEVTSMFTATVDQCKLVNYQFHPAIKAPMAV